MQTLKPRTKLILMICVMVVVIVSTVVRLSDDTMSTVLLILNVCLVGWCIYHIIDAVRRMGEEGDESS